MDNRFIDQTIPNSALLAQGRWRKRVILKTPWKEQVRIVQQTNPDLGLTDDLLIAFHLGYTRTEHQISYDKHPLFTTNRRWHWKNEYHLIDVCLRKDVEAFLWERGIHTRFHDDIVAPHYPKYPDEPHFRLYATVLEFKSNSDMLMTKMRWWP